MNTLGCQVAEISSSLGGGRHTVCTGRADVAALALIVAKDEELVLEDRSAERAAKFVPVAFRNTGCCLSKRVFGEIRVRALIIKCRTMNFICAGLSLRCHHSANGLAELRVVVLLGNLNFLNGLEIGINDDNSKDRVLVVGTVQLKAL